MGFHKWPYPKGAFHVGCLLQAGKSSETTISWCSHARGAVVRSCGHRFVNGCCVQRSGHHMEGGGLIQLVGDATLPCALGTYSSVRTSSSLSFRQCPDSFTASCVCRIMVTATYFAWTTSSQLETRYQEPIHTIPSSLWNSKLRSKAPAEEE
jgi:hypothetical protein